MHKLRNSELDPNPDKTRWCHHCRAKKPAFQCRNEFISAVAKEKICRKAFCHSCLKKYYNEKSIDVLGNPLWRCPSCRNICQCSICSKQMVAEPPKNIVLKDSQLDLLFSGAFRLMENLTSELKREHQSRVFYPQAERSIEAAYSSLHAALLLVQQAETDQGQEVEDQVAAGFPLGGEQSKNNPSISTFDTKRSADTSSWLSVPSTSSRAASATAKKRKGHESIQDGIHLE
eukprot:GILK01003401.1.p1 GENE.GILK01003401.1~~GILK01003401.1.p1  ORF type:complete len:231 (+),score=45.23 GILK01003401.1:174-866(+)